jgi:DNA-binding MarR family transcriptional regulator
MKKKELVNSCFNGFARLLNMFSEIQKVARDYGTGESLFPSEIHIIDGIGRNPEASISDLGRFMGITRGAVQQVSARLEVKDYICRVVSRVDKTKIILSLTEKGKSVYRGHQKFHNKMYDEIISQLSRLTEKELEKTISIFGSIEDNFKDYLQDGYSK